METADSQRRKFQDELLSYYVFILRGMDNREVIKAMAAKYKDFDGSTSPAVVAYHRNKLTKDPQSPIAIAAKSQFAKQPASDSAEDFDRAMFKTLKKLGLCAAMLVGSLLGLLVIAFSNWFVGTLVVVLALGGLRLALE